MIESGKNGFLVSPKFHNNFAEVIIRLLDNFELNTAVAIHARKKIMLQYSQTEISKTLQTSYLKAIKNENEHKK